MSSEPPGPLIALISSTCSQKHAINRGFKSLAHLIYPFTTHECSLREPVENTKISHCVRLDIRDITSDGHLLTLSVLPYVLIQALKNFTDVGQSIKLFRDVLSRWAEPSEHESFGHYLACIFVISTQDDNPLGELSKMIQTQQTLYNTTSTLMIPGHCAAPKWAAPHAKTPRHYILLHDSRCPRSSTERRDEVFAQMCSTYGTDNCQVLQLDSDCESTDMIGVWQEIDEFNDVLEKGLEEAHRHSCDSIPSAPDTNNASLNSPTSFVSTISSALSSNVGSVSPTSPPTFSNSIVWKGSPKIASLADAQNVEKVLSRFLTNCLAPHVEQEIRTLYENAGQKKSISKSVASVTMGFSKWLRTGSSSNNLATPITYSWESLEMQKRRLADLFMTFGLPGAAYDQYHPLKKDLETDKAMAAHAVALEMCALSLHNAQPHLNAKQFPIRYLDPPVKLLIEHAKFRKYPSVIRCALNMAGIYADLGLHKEAAATLAQLTSMDLDHLVAVAQTLAAEQYEKAGMMRKASFHRVLAANRFSNAAISALSFDCYRQALPAFDKKHWGVLDEHLAVRLLQEGEKAGVMTPEVASECIARLVAVCPKLTPAQQSDRLKIIVHALMTYFPQRTELLLNIPKVEMETIKVIYGERPLWNEIDENEHQSMTPDGWVTVERAAHYALFGASAPFRGMQMVSDEHSDNQKVRDTPANERFRVMVDLTNPLKIPIDLQNVRLSVADAQFQGNESGSPELGALPHLHLEPEESKTVELYVFPRIGCLKFRVEGLLFQLTVDGKAVETRVALECRGKRLNKTAKQQKSKVYTNDERLSAAVSQKPWPLIEFRVLKSPHKWSYCDQAQRYQMEIENIGQEDVMAMSLATNAFDRVSAGNLDEEDRMEGLKLELAANNSKVATFAFRNTIGAENVETPFLKIGQKKRIFFDIRSSDEPTGSVVTSQATVILIAYRCSSGSMRQWRRVIDGERRRLIQISSEILDQDSGSFAIHLKNYVALSQAALSRVEILRIRTAKNLVSTGVGGSLETGLSRSIELSSTTRKIEIESEQTDTIVARLIPSPAPCEEVWLSSTGQHVAPQWPCPAEIRNAMDDEAVVRIPEKIGVLWKASIVNNEGLVTSFIGESFLDDPFARKNSKLAGATSNQDALQISVETPAKEISHNFSKYSVCEIPVTVCIHNKDPAHRPAHITIKNCPKVRDAVDGIHLVAPESRQQMWLDRPTRRCTVQPGDVSVIKLRWKITHAAVYDVGGPNLTVEAVFDGATQENMIFKVPSMLSIVKSSPYTVV